MASSLRAGVLAEYDSGNDPDAAYRTIQYAIDKSYGNVIYVKSGT